MLSSVCENVCAISSFSICLHLFHITYDDPFGQNEPRTNADDFVWCHVVDSVREQLEPS